VPTFDVLLGAFGAGVYLIVAITHLDLWVRRREGTGHLWLALASASALLVDVTGIAIAFAAAPAPALLALNMLGVAGATASLLELVSALARSPTGRWSRRLQVAVLVCAPVTAVLPPLTGAVLVSCGLLLGASVTRAIRAARLDRDSKVVARAFLVLVACLLADLTKELLALPIPDNLPLAGFTILFLAAAHSLNDRFEREHDASRHDALTGLRNRRSFLESWEEALQRSRRSGKPMSLVLGDLDHFKRVNDTHGHACGDAVLRAVAQAIRNSLRVQDVVSRWGGEEFMLLLPDTDLAGARHVAESTRLAIRALRVEHAGSTLAVTISLGVCEHRPGRSMEETIADADAALYQAKQEGRDRVIAR
jgi:diguanylate cyclase (GGDEF)-like protein